jgi:hypothetical protein
MCCTAGNPTHDKQFGVSVQQQILPRVSVDVGYNRRWFGNHLHGQSPISRRFDVATMTAPLNANPPNGGGYPVTFVTRNARSCSAPPTTTTRSRAIMATPRRTGMASTCRSMRVSGTASPSGWHQHRTGRVTTVRSRINSEIFVTPLSVLANQQVGACAVTEPWLTTVRGLVSYTIPKVDVLLSSSFRSTANVQPSTVNTFVASNGASVSANENVTSAVLQQSTLGRGLAPGLPFQTVDLTLPGQVYPDRINSLDMRVAKVLKFGRFRTNVGFDFYNLFNANTGTAFNQVYDVASNGASWLRPTTILGPRFARFNVTVDF